jgi:hypothetical protein
MLGIFKFPTKEKCAICNKPLKLDDWKWVGLNGNKVHKDCLLKKK